MDKQVERQINKIFNAVYKKIFSSENIQMLQNGSKDGILNSYATFTSSEQYDKFAQKFAQELTKMGLNKQKGVWRKFYEVAKKSHVVGLPYSYNEYEQQMMRDIIQHNFQMIQSVPQRVMEILEYKSIDTLINEVGNGTLPRNTFRKELEQHKVKKAKLIARTETAKLQSAITEKRATNIGSVAYEWVASHDKRTRPSHKEMDGVIVFWRPDSQKPLRDNMRGNAGEFPNCRCYPAPILDEKDLKGTNFKVYNYHNDTIEKSWSRHKLIEALERKNI